VNRACVLALDLGTTAFKAAPVDADGWCGAVATARYALDTTPDGRVACPPERYRRAALRVLRAAARSARAAGRTVEAIGISSQAQTFAACDDHWNPVEPFLAWTEAGATAEAAAAAMALPDFARQSGFVEPSPLQILPKWMRRRREVGGAPRCLQLPEWIVHELTGAPLGDTMIQGMGGLLDIRSGSWNPEALHLAGLAPEQLAPIAPPGTAGRRLTRAMARALGLAEVPVAPCGNDQTCAAVGAGADGAGHATANFGTAMVVHRLLDRPAHPRSGADIVGIGPWPGTWFHMAVENECANLLDGVARWLYPGQGTRRLLEDAAGSRRGPTVPTAVPTGSGRLDLRGLAVGTSRADIARALVDTYAAAFTRLLGDVLDGGAPPARIGAGGGLSRSSVWLESLGAAAGVRLEPCPLAHPGLVGVARILARNLSES